MAGRLPGRVHGGEVKTKPMPDQNTTADDMPITIGMTVYAREEPAKLRPRPTNNATGPTHTEPQNSGATR